ncbi:MAG TPA: LacI family DNA-binding transcriptional regulator [Candidatus Acidoferrales bacterium]|nr:LacI family DNA-binding transcriptional regulator [Candidatus Acidoferrales bacterium]
MALKVTIYDIAREASVGIGTVSRVLNNHPNVTPETRQRVKDVLRRLKYQPHTYAQRLARRQSETVSAIIPFFTNYFFIEVLQGVQDRISQLGYDLVLYGVNDVSQVEAYLARALQRGKVDGILFFSMKLPEKIIPRLEETGLPVVLVDTTSPDFDSISVANAEGAYAATTHLIELGHRKVGLINAKLASTPAIERLQGYRRALENHGIIFSDTLVRTGNNNKQDGFNREAGYEAMMEFIKTGSEMPRAFFISSDIQAMGSIAALAENGLKVPEDVAIVGFDDIELARHIKLTTMRQPMYQIGVLALERLVARMANPDMEVLHTTFSPTLIVRESCGALRRNQN